MLQRRQQLFVNRHRRADVHTGRNDIIAALAHIDVIVGMHFATRSASPDGR